MTDSQVISNSLLEQYKQEQLKLMTLTMSILNTLLENLDPQVATEKRERPKGWNVTEVMCHLRDFDVIFRDRSLQILAEEYPSLQGFDQDQLALDRNYASQNLQKVLKEFSESRTKTIQVFSDLKPTDLLRAGLHPERGNFSLLNQLMQEGIHDTLHIHQITRILKN